MNVLQVNWKIDCIMTMLSILYIKDGERKVNSSSSRKLLPYTQFNYFTLKYDQPTVALCVVVGAGGVPIEVQQ